MTRLALALCALPIALPAQEEATAPGVTASSSPAALKLACRAAASKARKALSGGPFGRGGEIAMAVPVVFLGLRFIKTGLRAPGALWFCAAQPNRLQEHDP